MKRVNPIPPSRRNRSGLARLVKLCKTGVMSFLLIQVLFLDILPVKQSYFWVKEIGVILFIIGLLVAVLGRYELGANWSDIEESQTVEGHVFVESGIYNVIRHPIYTGDVLLVVGLEMAMESWLILIAIPLLFIVVNRALAEEKKMSCKFPEYAAYALRTKRFIPFVL